MSPTQMESTGKHYKFINSNTGYVIYYYSITGSHSHEQINAELEGIKLKVATQNGLNSNTLYWEQILDE